MRSSTHALFHTNKPLYQAPSGFHGISGWWADRASTLGHFPVTGRYMKKSNVTHKLKARWNLPQMLKYEWSINASTSEEWLLTDTDTVFQCTPSELKARFKAFGAPVVIGTERWWFPRPKGTQWKKGLDPFLAACGGSALNRYPNSGLLMGTRLGFERIVQQMRAYSTFPCCSIWMPEQECFVDDQACLHAALADLRLATWPASTDKRKRQRRVCMQPLTPFTFSGRHWGSASNHSATSHVPPLATTFDLEAARVASRRLSIWSTGRARTKSAVLQSAAIPNVKLSHLEGAAGRGVDYALDVRASLFLNLFMVTKEELSINERGQLSFRQLGQEHLPPTVPCVVHTNAYKSPHQLRELVNRWTHVTWVPARATRIQRWLCDRFAAESIAGSNLTICKPRTTIKGRRTRL